jgi:alkylation response protein AidB-like acyl-CoA dehydrogenase
VICKAGMPFVAEAMEVLGGIGYCEESELPLQLQCLLRQHRAHQRLIAKAFAHHLALTGVMQRS